MPIVSPTANSSPHPRSTYRESTMPLVRISLQSGKPASYRTAISNQVYEGTGETLEIPEGDRFQLITEHDDGTLVRRIRSFMGTESSADSLLIQMFLSRGRTTASKQTLYRSIAEQLAKSPSIRPDDVIIVPTAVGLDDWSFGRGEAQYVLHPATWTAKKDKLSAGAVSGARTLLRTGISTSIESALASRCRCSEMPRCHYCC